MVAASSETTRPGLGYASSSSSPLPSSSPSLVSPEKQSQRTQGRRTSDRMSYSRHATAPDQPAGYRAVRLVAPGAAIVHPAELFSGDFPANRRAQPPPRDWACLLDEEQPGIRSPPRSGNDGHFRPRFSSICRCGDVACNLHKMEKALRGTFLDTSSSNESTIHPANRLLVQALQDLVRSARHANEHYSRLLHCWASELERDAEMVCPGEKGRKHMFLLNNAFGVLQIMTLPGAPFSNQELVSTLASTVERYKKSYFHECWLPLKNALHLNLDEFATELLDTCANQRTWKVTAELRYKLRQEVVGLIVTPYKVSLSAERASRSRLSGVLCLFERAIAGKKKQKKHTAEDLEGEINGLFEG